jgi:hypothetical protein
MAAPSTSRVCGTATMVSVVSRVLSRLAAR